MADPIMPYGFMEINLGEGNWQNDHNDNFQRVNDKLKALVDMMDSIINGDVLVYDSASERMVKCQFGDIFSINLTSKRIDLKADSGNFTTDDILFWGGSQIKGLGLNTDFFQIITEQLEPKFPGGATIDRPSSPVIFQSYFDTDLGYTVWWDGSDWVDGSGTSV